MPIKDTIKKLDELRGIVKARYSHTLISTENYQFLCRAAIAGQELAEAVRTMGAKRKFPPMYEPREMDAFKNGRDSTNEEWSKQRDAALATYRKAIEE